MPQKPILPDDVYADISFPLGGLDLALGFGGQRPGTTRVGVNVRANEPLAQSSRGGARPGLVRYIDGRVNGVHLVQHLNYVVDPQATALPWYDPPFPNPDDTDGPGVAGGLNLLAPSSAAGTGPVFGSYTDPDGYVIRYGGTGVRYRRRQKPTGVQAVYGLAVDVMMGLAYPSPVTANTLLVAVLFGFSKNATGAMSVSDTRGNVWTLADRVDKTFLESASGTITYQLSMSMWYCVSNGAGADTVTTTMVGGGGGSDIVQTVLLEHRRVLTVAPLRAVSSGAEIYGNTAAPLPPPAGNVVSGGSLASQATDLALSVFAGINSTSPFTPQSGFTSRIDTSMMAQDRVGVAGSTAVTATGTFTGTDAAYVAIGAAFKGA